MIDDHDRCEWVNVVLVPARSRCPVQNAESCKVVVVVVVVLVLLLVLVFDKWN